MNKNMEREILSILGQGGDFEDLRRRYVRLIETNQVPYAENITARSDWLFYVYFCRLVSRALPDRQARIIDWGGLYGHVTQILRQMGYTGTSNYLLHESPHYALFQQTFHLPTLWGRHPNRLELVDQSVDAFISSGVLEHVREDGVGDEGAILEEIRRVLKQDGRLFVWNLPARWGSSELLAILAGKWHHTTRYKKKEIVNLFSATGLEIVSLDKHKFLPGTAREWLGQRIDPVRLLAWDDRLSRRLPFSLFARDYLIVAQKNRDMETEINRHPAVFHLHGVSKVYRMGEVTVQALKNVNLDLFQGEFVVLLGPSGSGKSTLVNILGGLDVPTAGEVFYLDHNLTALDDAALTVYRREHVGFVFQFYNLIPSLTALENVALVTDIAEKPMDPVRALELVDLGNRRHHFPAQLSGGEQQRVAIARAVVKQPDVLLCDEPTGALDYGTGKLVLEVLEKVNRELGTITVVITHNAAIAGMADRVIRISSGEIVEIRSNERRASPSELSW